MYINKKLLLPLLSLSLFSCAGNYLDLPIKIISKYIDGKSIITRAYNSKHEKIEENGVYYNDQGEKLFSETLKWTYNNRGEEETKIITRDGKETCNVNISYEYDEKGNITLKHTTGSIDGSFVNKKTIITYDDLSRPLIKEYKESDSLDIEPLPVSKYTYIYKDGFDYQNFVSMDYSLYIGDSYKILETTTQELDDKGRVKTLTFYDQEISSQYYTYQSTYTYDEYDCPIMIETHYNIDEEIITCNKELINLTYYKNNPKKYLTYRCAYYIEIDSDTDVVLYEESKEYTYDNHDRIKTVSGKYIDIPTFDEYFY